MKKIILIFCFFLALSNAKATGRLVYYKALLRDKTETIILKDSSSKNYDATLLLRASPFLESKKYRGTTRLLIYTLLSGLSKRDTLIGNIQPDFQQGYTVLHFYSKDSSSIINLLNNLYKGAFLDSMTMESCREKAIQSYAQLSPTSAADLKLMQYLWKDYLFRVHTIQERQDIRQISFLELKNFYNTYFLPQNSLLFIRTQKEPYALFDRLSPFVNGADMGRNAYNSLGKTNIYRNLINSVQVIERDTTNSYRNASLMWQVVGDLRDGNSYLCADLYKDLLNQWFDEGKLGNNAITNLHASLYTQRFMCELRVDFSLSGTEKAAVYELKEKLNNLKIDSLCTNENLMSMLTQRLAAQELSYSDPQRYSESLALWWDLHGTDYALNMDKNLKSISRADIQRFYTLFVKDRPTVFSLKTKSNLTGTDYLAEANDTIVKTFIAFDNNMSEITEQRSKNTLISILQYLTANPDINVRVNGLADSKEFLKADAKDLEPFLQKYPMFKVISANPGKSTWQRLDMVRALRIVKFLISNGISPERINGSGMIAKNNDEEDVATHRIVSFTFDKIRKHASQISSAP